MDTFWFGGRLVNVNVNDIVNVVVIIHVVMVVVVNLAGSRRCHDADIKGTRGTEFTAGNRKSHLFTMTVAVVAFGIVVKAHLLGSR